MHVISAGIGEALTTSLRFIQTVAIRNLCHRWDIFRIKLAERVHVAKNGIQIPHHAAPFLAAQFEVREVCNIGDVLFSNFHNGSGDSRLRPESQSLTFLPTLISG